MTPELQSYLKLLVKICIPFIVMLSLFFFFSSLLPLFFNLSGTILLSLLPFVLALVIAILIDPLVDWLERKKGIKRGWAVLFTLVILLLFISLALVFIISRLVIELVNLYSSLPGFSRVVVNDLLQYIEELRKFITNNPLPYEAQNVLRTNLEVIINQIGEMALRATNFFYHLLTGLPAFVTIIIVAAIATFFISRDKELITRFIYRSIPRKLVKPTSTVVHEVSSALVGFFRAQTILISITAMLTILGLSFLGVDYSLTIGFLVGIFDLLPILGPGTILVPWAVLQFIMGNIHFGVALLILYGILVGVRQLIEPKILAENIGLHPLATLLSLYLGLKLLGVLGLIVGPFIVIVIKALIKGWAQE